MTYYAPPDQVDQLEYSAKIGKEILTFFEGYYNIPYPLPKAGMYVQLFTESHLRSPYCVLIVIDLSFSHIKLVRNTCAIHT